MSEPHPLNQKEIIVLYKAALALGFAGNRPALLAGIDRTVRAQLCEISEPGAQLLSDLAALRDIGVLVDRSVPIIIWLNNAVALAGKRTEVSTFQRALKATNDHLFPRPHNSAQHVPPPPKEPPTPYAKAWWRSALFMVLVGVIVFGLTRTTWADACEPWRIARTLTDGLQLIVVAFAFVWIKIDHDLRPDDGASKEYVGPFRHYWKKLWLSWCIFYLYHTVREVVEDNALRHHEPLNNNHWDPWTNVGTNLLHSAQSMALLILFLMMRRPTFIKYHTLRSMTKSWWVLTAVWYLGLPLAQLLLFFVFRDQVYYSFLVNFVAALVTGVVAMICMGMFFGQLASAFLDVHPVELAALLLYAGIQPFYPVIRTFEAHLTNKSIVILELSLKSLACALKLGLYFVVRRQINSRRLAFYMLQQKKVCTNALDDWNTFREGPPS